MNDSSINALVTGGAHRIGRAIALDLAANGIGVAIHANSSLDEAEELATEIKENGGKAVALQADLNNVGEAQELVEHASSALGGLNMLINNASVFEDDSIHALDDAMWNTHFDIHLKSPVFMSSSFAKMLGEKTGLIVNIIDQRVWRLNPTFMSYTLSKSALWTATQTMAQALGPNIRVNAIGPGPTLKNARQKDSDFAIQKEALILGDGPDLEEFGATIRYLWSVKSVTGQMIALDGGQHLAWETPDALAKE